MAEKSNQSNQRSARKIIVSRQNLIGITYKVFIGVLGVISLGIVAQGQAIDGPLDRQTRTQVVEAAADALETRYVFPDQGRAMASALRKQNANHAYDALSTRAELSMKLTEDLYAVGHDKHIHIDHTNMRPAGPGGPQPRFIPAGRSGGPEPKMRMDGPPPPTAVTEFKRLSDKVGYIRVDRMLPAEGEGDSIDTAMAALVGSKALIIDLRQNGGGDPQMVAYLCTYLFPAGAHIHLNDFIDRDDPEPRAAYTFPSVPGKSFDGDVYILTSHRTFSAGEEMAYDLQALKRATIVGETTGGGANPGMPFPLPSGFSIFVPTGRPINPVTKTNWEGVGVKPDVAVPAEEALEKAQALAQRKL